MEDIADVLVEITASPKIMKEESKKEEREVSLKKKDNLFGCGFCLTIIAIVVFSEKSGRCTGYTREDSVPAHIAYSGIWSLFVGLLIQYEIAYIVQLVFDNGSFADASK